MLQQDLLDTLFLNKKALAAVGGTTTSGSTTSRDDESSANTAMKDTGANGAAAAAAATEQCPVDHKSREAWLAQARAAQQSTPPSSSLSQQAQATTPVESKQSSSGWGWRIPFFGSSSSSATTSSTTNLSSTTPTQSKQGSLGTNRVVSTIPRSTGEGATTSACPVNHETETGADPKTGNWVYPSEKMFFDAMKRKGHDTQAQDMKTVVPIHNAVNERAWHEIKEWERPYQATSCPGGPRLYSFTGLSTKMSPKARFNTLLGYTAPFDRHDWVVDRCGMKVEYVIDFYAGKAATANGKPSFYLDVRPKLNSWEGVKMRAARLVGMA